MSEFFAEAVRNHNESIILILASEKSYIWTADFKANWIRHILKKNCLFHIIIKGRTHGWISRSSWKKKRAAARQLQERKKEQSLKFLFV